MITFKEIINEVFSTFGLDFDTVSNTLSNLKTANIQPNNLVAGMNAYKYFKAEAETYFLGEDFMECIDELMIGETVRSYTRDEVAKTLSDSLMSMCCGAEHTTFNFDYMQSWIQQATGDDGRTVTVGYVCGSPIIANFKTHYDGRWDSDVIDLYVRVGSENPTSTLVCTWNQNYQVETRTDSSDVGLAIPRIPGEIGSMTYATILDVANELNDGMSNNQLFCDLISAAQANGTLDKSSIKAIVANYEGCTAASNLKERISCINELSSGNVLSLIAGVLNDATANAYTEDNDYYEPLKTPKFTKNIVGTVLSILVSVLAVVLSIVFKAAAAIIAVIWTVVTTIIQAIVQAAPDTNPKFVRTADLPVWNYPVYTRTGIPIIVEAEEPEDPEWNLSDFYQTSNEFGTTAAISTIYDSVCIWFAQDGYNDVLDQSTMFGQILLPCWKYHIDNLGAYRYTINGTTSLDCSIPVYEGNPDGVYAAHSDQDLSWLTYTQDTSSASSTGAISKDLWYRLLSIIRWNAKTVDNETDKIHVTFASQSPSWITPTTFNNYVEFLRNIDSVAVEDLSVEEKCTLAYCVFRKLYYYDPDFTVSFEQVVDVINTTFIQNVCATTLPWWMYEVTDPREAETAELICGRDCLDPCAEFPQIAKGAIFRTILFLAITAAVTAAVTIGVKAHRKSKAIKRLTLREAQFSQAQEAYAANPSEENLKKLKKANRKLGKSWDKAARAGVQSWNGFATGSDADTISYDTLQEKLESEYAPLEDSSETVGVVNSNNDNISTIIGLIAGSTN